MSIVLRKPKGPSGNPESNPAETHTASTGPELVSPKDAGLSDSTKAMQDVFAGADQLNNITSAMERMVTVAIASANGVFNSAGGGGGSGHSAGPGSTAGGSPGGGSGTGGAGGSTGGGGMGGAGMGGSGPNTGSGPGSSPSGDPFDAIIKAVDETAKAITDGNLKSNAELRQLRLQIGAAASEIARNGINAIPESQIENLNKAADKLHRAIVTLGDSVEPSLKNLETTLGDFTKTLTEILADHTAAGLTDVKTALDTRDPNTAALINKLLSKVDALGDLNKLEDDKFTAIKTAYEKLTADPNALKASLGHFHPDTELLVQELGVEIKKITAVGEKLHNQRNPQPQPKALENEIGATKTAVEELLKLVETHTGTKQQIQLTAGDANTLTNQGEAVTTKLQELTRGIITNSSVPGSGIDLQELVKLQEQMDLLNFQLANFISRSDKVFEGNKGIKGKEITFDGDYGKILGKLHEVNKGLHKCVEEMVIRHPDIVSLGGQEKLGQSAILNMLSESEKNPRGFSSHKLLAELHCRGWIRLASLEEKNGKLSFTYEGSYQSKRDCQVAGMSQWRWGAMAWAIAGAAPAAAFFGVLGGTGPLGIGLLMAGGAAGFSFKSTVQSLFTSRFQKQLQKNAIGEAYTPERMIAEAILVAKSMQGLSNQVGALDVAVLPLLGTESNNPHEVTTKPAVVAIKRAVLTFNKVARGTSTDAKNARAEYEDALKSIIPVLPPLAQGWSRFVDSPVNIMMAEFGLGTFGAVGAGIRWFFPF
jgi:hypothetical protein